VTEPPRDWDKELAKIDKVMARQPAEPPAAAGPARPPAGGTARPAAAPFTSRRAIARTWFLAGLGVALAVALPLWPYPKACGMQLAFYLGAVGLALLVGLWSALTSWRARRGVAHFLSLLTVAWAAVLLAGAVLPRIGYAKLEQTWICR